MNKREFLQSLGMGLLWAMALRRRPKNWVWISKQSTPTEDAWNDMFRRLHVKGIEAVAVETGGDAPAYLEPILGTSRTHALEVHAWVRITDPESRDSLRSTVAELADIPTLIGVHLDVGAPARWDELTELVNEHLVPAARSRGTLLSAAVPAADSAHWSRWKLDAFLAGVSGAAACGAQIREAVSRTAIPVYCGVSARALDAAALAGCAQAALSAGAAGIAVGDLDAMDEARWTAFQEAVAIG